MNEQLSFGQLIRQAMDSRGITQRELADATGWSQSVISDYVKGKRTVTPPEVVRTLARVLGIPIRTQLEALGYLDPEELEPGVAYVIRVGDARTSLLDAVAGQPPSAVDRYATILRMIIGGSESGRIETDPPRSAAGS